MAKKMPPFMGKESKSEERKEKKMGKKAYMRGEKAEGDKYATGGIVRGMGAAKRGGRFVRSC